LAQASTGGVFPLQLMLASFSSLRQISAFLVGHAVFILSAGKIVVGMSTEMMTWNDQAIPVQVALQIGWNLPMDVVGAGVYGGIVKRDAAGKIIVGDEWPEDNRAPPAHNPIHPTGPYLDSSKYTASNRGYTKIANVLQHGNADEVQSLFNGIKSDAERRKLANLVMTGGARPLHMCGMSWGADASELIAILIQHGADVNAKDNYEMTPMDRLSSNSVSGNAVLLKHGAVPGRTLSRGVPQWGSDDFDYTGPGEF